MPELNFALQPSFLALGQSAPASDAGIFKGADMAQRNKDRAVQEKQVNAQLARDALNAQLQPYRMREAELKVKDLAADMAWQSTRRELESEASKTFNDEAPKILAMQKDQDPFGAYKATFDLGIRYPILSGYKPYQDLMEHAKAGAGLEIQKQKVDELDRYHQAIAKERGTTTAEKNVNALIEARQAARMTRGEPQMNPAEEAAERAELLSSKLLSSESMPASQKELIFFRTLTDPQEIELFTAKMLGRAGQAKNEAQLMEKFATQEKIRNLKLQALSQEDFDLELGKILSDYKQSLGQSGSVSPDKPTTFEFKREGGQLKRTK